MKFALLLCVIISCTPVKNVEKQQSEKVKVSTIAYNDVYNYIPIFRLTNDQLYQEQDSVKVRRLEDKIKQLQVELDEERKRSTLYYSKYISLLDECGGIK